MSDLTPAQRRALQWLQPGENRRPTEDMLPAIADLAEHRPDLCGYGHGPPAGYFLTREGERVRGELMEQKDQATGHYRVVKGRAHYVATVVSGKTNQSAQAAGFKDVFDLIMSDSHHERHQEFLAWLASVMPIESDRQLLLDGLAREYAGLDGWTAYVEQERRER